MKKIFYNVAFAVVLALGLSSCSEDRELLADNVQTLYQFNENNSTLYVTPDVTSTKVPFGVTTRSSADRVIPIIIDVTSTADASLYNISSAITIPANQFIGYIDMNVVNPAALVDGEEYTVVIRIDDEQYPVLDQRSYHVLTFMRACESDLGGQYSVTTTYGFHDFLPDYDSNTMEVTLLVPAGAPPSTYRVTDFSGGLYSVGPYSTAYGTGSPGNAGNRDLSFMVYCSKQIGWKGQTDPYGAILPTPGAVNRYDEATGVITISWTCAGYGEYGVSVYTPL